METSNADNAAFMAQLERSLPPMNMEPPRGSPLRGDISPRGDARLPAGPYQTRGKILRTHARVATLDTPRKDFQFLDR